LGEQASIVALVDRILAARWADTAADVAALEAEGDRLVSGLYGLNCDYADYLTTMMTAQLPPLITVHPIIRQITVQRPTPADGGLRRSN
jgi:hypothetical protein